jgi:mRNA interferase MazF
VGKPLKGQVVVVPFPFSDLTQSKRRPALVVASLAGEDLILSQITSQQRGDPDAVPLHDADFADGGLHRASFVRPARLFTAETSLVLRIAGTLHPASMRRVTEKLIEILRR